MKTYVIISSVVSLFLHNAYSQSLPDTTYFINYPSGEIYKKISVYKYYYTSEIEYCIYQTEYSKDKKPLLATGTCTKGDTITSDSIYYFGDTKVKRHIGYKNAVLNGPYEEYYEGGNIAISGNYEMGKKEGKWIYQFLSNNRMEATIHVYENNIIKKVEYWCGD